MNKRILRLILLTLCAVCLLSSMGATAMAAGRIDLDEDVSLTVSYVFNKIGIPGVTLSVYRVADIDEWGDFTLSGDFKGYDGEINGWHTAGEWSTLASKLQSYASKEKLTAFKKGKTGSNGRLTLSDGMEPGLYLVISTDTKYNGVTYTAKPSLVSLPGYDEYHDEWIYDVVANAKVGAYSTPTPTPTPSPTPPPYLPQTGLLWWPVPVLLCGGMLCLIIGAVCSRREKDES